MTSFNELPSESLPLDTELVDNWTIDTTFEAGEELLKFENVLQIVPKDQDSRGADKLFVTSLLGGNPCTISLLAPDVYGTQAEALQRTSIRYKRVLGATAVRQNLIVAKMNLRSIVQSHISRYLPYDRNSDEDLLDQLERVTDEDLELMRSHPEAPKLDVTDHLARILDELDEAS